jgi:hypothetical protein
VLLCLRSETSLRVDLKGVRWVVSARVKLCPAREAPAGGKASLYRTKRGGWGCRGGGEGSFSNKNPSKTILFEYFQYRRRRRLKLCAYVEVERRGQV